MMFVAYRLASVDVKNRNMLLTKILPMGLGSGENLFQWYLRSWESTAESVGVRPGAVPAIIATILISPQELNLLLT